MAIPGANGILTSFTYEGDFEEANFWLPYAKSLLQTYARNGVRCTNVAPVDGVEIRIDTFTGRIHIKAGGGVKVCWFTGIGSEFISETGSRLQKNTYLSSSGHSYTSNYWVNSEFTDAISVSGLNVYRGGKLYIGDEAVHELDLYSLKASIFNGNPLFIYQQWGLGEYIIASGSLSDGEYSISTRTYNLSNIDENIIFVGCGGKDTLWTISRRNLNDSQNGSSCPFTTVACYRISNSTPSESYFTPNLTLLAQKQLDCTKYGTRVYTNDITLDGINIRQDIVLTQDYSELNKIQDVFIEGNSLSIGVRNVFGSDRYIYNNSNTLESLVQPGYTFSSAVKTSSDVFVTSVNSELDPQYWTNSSPLWLVLGIQQTVYFDVTIALPTGIFTTFTGDTTTCSKNLTSYKYDLVEDVNNGYILQEITVFQEHPEDINTTFFDTSMDRENINFQYSDGVNNQHSVLHEDMRDISLYRQVIVTGAYGSITDLDVQIISDTQPSVQSFFSGNYSVQNSNSSIAPTNQGYIGAFDGKTYLMQTFSPVSPYYDHFAFSKNGILIREQGDYRSLTVGS